jgi:integrase
MPPRLPGAHRVVRKLSGGRASIYWYKTRGGEKMMQFDGASLDEALRAEHEGAQALAAAYAEGPKAVGRDDQTVRGLIIQYRASPAFQKLAESTKAEWRRCLDVIEAEFGTMPLKALESKAARTMFIKWRDGFAGTARSADYRMQVLKRIFSWGVENTSLTCNPVEGVEGIYRSKRADLIVSPSELDAIIQHVTPEASRAIRFAAATGIRREDLVSIRWDHVHGNFIRFATGKSGGRKTVVVPLFGAASEIVAELREARERCLAENKVPSAFLLLTAKGTPWKPDSLTQAFIRAAKQANVDRHLNDLRGTAITNFAVAGLTNEQIADIVGWEVNRVSNIRKHYVDPARMAELLIERLEGAAKTG